MEKFTILTIKRVAEKTAEEEYIWNRIALTANIEIVRLNKDAAQACTRFFIRIGVFAGKRERGGRDYWLLKERCEL